MQNYLDTNGSSLLHFSSLFSAVQTVSAVLGKPVSISANEQVLVAQAVMQSGQEFSLLDVDYHGLAMANDVDGIVLATDYAGIIPLGRKEIEVWLNGAGFIDKDREAEVAIIDLTTLDLEHKASGAVISCQDQNLLQELRRYATLGVMKGPVWNDKVNQSGIDGLMSELVSEYWQQNIDSLIEETIRREEVVQLYRERFVTLKLIDLMPTAYPRFFPVRLAPELLCPKEDIYTALHEQKIKATVPYKPLYRYDLFKGESLRGAEEFYKAALALPMTTDLDEAKRVADVFVEVIDRYAYRGCSF